MMVSNQNKEIYSTRILNTPLEIVYEAFAKIKNFAEPKNEENFDRLARELLKIVL